MNETQSCLSKQVLNKIGHDEILPDELQSIEDHVSQCQHCRSLFTAATTEPEWTENIRPVLRDHKSDLLDTSDPDHEQADRWSGNDAALRLLGPTDDPRMLGRIGHYEVTGIIGRGGMGVVFKAFDAPLNRFVAIKMLLPHLASSGSARKRFTREGQAAAAVVDDHVLPIYGVDEWRGVPYIVMQYSSATSLQKRIHEQGPLGMTEILRISMQIARGLSAAHAQGLVHRDVKPSNILLDSTVERALLTDFGLARAVDDATITRSGTISGTPQFMAPEQARGESIDQRGDLFSLGAVMYAMCTGHPPFRAETSYGVLRRIIDEEPRLIRETNPEIPGWYCEIVSRLMAKQPGERFASAGEVADLLEACLAHVQQPTMVPLPKSLGSSVPPPTRRFVPPVTKWLAAFAAVFFFALAGIAVVSELNRTDSSDQSSPSRAPNAVVSDSAKEQIGTVLGKPVLSTDLNKNVELREDLERLFVRPVEEKYLVDQQLDPAEELQRRIPDKATRLATLMFVRQRVLHEHLYQTRGGRVLLTAFGPIAYDAHRQWLQERERAGDFQLTAAKHRDLLFASLADPLKSRLTEDPHTIERAFDPAITEEFITSMSEIQAMSDRGASNLPAAVEAQLAGLPARIFHDFIEEGLPGDRFALRGDQVDQHVVAFDDGLRVTHPGEAGYSNSSIETQLRVQGNFDVTVSFENFAFEPCDDGSASIALNVIIDNDVHTHGSVQRGVSVDPDDLAWHFVQSEFVHSPQREPGVTWLGTTATAETAGRLRLARIGKTLYCLFAAKDSSEYRLIHTEQIGSEDLLFGGVRLNTGVQSNGQEHGATSVVWKDLTIRAERITDWQGEEQILPAAEQQTGSPKLFGGKSLDQWIAEANQARDLEDRHNAMQVLRNFGLKTDRKKTLRVFTELLSDKVATIRSLAAAGLRKAGRPTDPKAVEKLVKILSQDLTHLRAPQDDDDVGDQFVLPIREAVALSELGDQSHLPVLERIADNKDNDPFLRQAAKNAIREFETRAKRSPPPAGGINESPTNKSGSR